MRRATLPALAAATLTFIALCATGCSGRPHPRSFATCPIVVRLTAAGDLFANDCRSQRQETIASLGRGLKTLLIRVDYETAPPVVIDADGRAPFRQVQMILTGLQDAGFYRADLADGPGQPPIPITLPPSGPGHPPCQAAVVIIRADHQLEVYAAAYPPTAPSSGGRGRKASPSIATPSRTPIAPDRLAIVLAAQPKGVCAVVGAERDTPWIEVKSVYRTLAQAGRTSIILQEAPP